MNKRLISKIMLGIFSALVYSSGASYAMPTNAHDTQNITSITQNKNVMDIVGKNNAVAKWSDFSLKKGESVNFKGMNNVLNIVDGNKFSTIQGAINGQGVNVYLINPNGVLFGDNSSVNVGSLTVSTQELSNSLTNSFVEKGTVITDNSKLGIGNVTMAGNIEANTIKVTGKEISLTNTDNLNAQKISLNTPSDGFINILKGQDISKLNLNGDSVRDDFEAIDSQEKLSSLKPDGHYMLTKDINVDDNWKGIKTNSVEPFSKNVIDEESHEWVTVDAPRNIANGLVINGMGHSIGNINKVGLFETNTKLYNTNISNIILEGNEISNKKADESAIFAEEADNIKVDNVISNIKTVDTNSENYNKGTGWFKYVDNSIFTNLTNNTNFTSRYTGNIAYITHNTDFINITNNGTGHTGVANVISGGNLIGCVNTGNVLESGLVKSYYNYYTDKSNNKIYKPVNIINNINKGNIANPGAYISDVGGIFGFGNFDGIEGEKKAVNISNNINYGNIQAPTFAGGIAGRINQYNLVSDSPIYMNNNTNYGNLTKGQNHFGGVVGYIGKGNFIGKHLYNYGSYIPNNEKHFASQLGGIIGGASDIKTMTLSYVENNPQNITTDIDKQDDIDFVGGIIGRIASDYSNDCVLNIDHAKNLGDIRGANDLGGLIGHVVGFDVSITDSFNKGNIYSYNNNYVQWYLGGLIGGNDNSNSFILNNVFNTGNIKGINGTAFSSSGGLVGHLSLKKDSIAQISNAFNTGNLENTAYYDGGFVGKSESPLIITNAYNTGNIIKNKNADIDKYWDSATHGLIVGKSEPVVLKNVYNTGEISRIDTVLEDKDKNALVGELNNSASDSAATLKFDNVYSTAKNTIAVDNNKANLSVSTNPIQILNDKKTSNFKGFDLDTTGTDSNATWRIYEGYTNPLLKVFMNDTELSNTDKTVEANNKEQSITKDDILAKTDLSNKNFFTQDIDYEQNSHIYDSKTQNEFEKLSGKNVGVYSTQVYSDQFGFNLKSPNNNETLTLTIEEQPVDIIIKGGSGYMLEGKKDIYWSSPQIVVTNPDGQKLDVKLNNNALDVDGNPKSVGSYQTIPVLLNTLPSKYHVHYELGNINILPSLKYDANLNNASKITLFNQSGSYKDFLNNKINLLNEKEISRTDDCDEIIGLKN